MPWRILVIPVLALALAGAAACGGGDDDGGDDGPAETTAPADTANTPTDGVIAVQAVDSAFDKASISAEVGSRLQVDFSNDGQSTHTFTVLELDVDLLLSGGDSGTLEFTFPDESFEFFCRIHPSQMRGTLEPTG